MSIDIQRLEEVTTGEIVHISDDGVVVKDGATQVEIHADGKAWYWDQEHKWVPIELHGQAHAEELVCGASVSIAN
jgi:hypothetical protein